jgi:hypothetical protein
VTLVAKCALAGALVFAAWPASGQDFDALVPGATSARGAAPSRPSGPPAAAPAAPTPATPAPSEPRAAARSQASAAPQPLTPPTALAGKVGGAVPVHVRTVVDRTATWIGDPVTYVVEISCPPGTDILAADLSRDRLRLTGLEVVDSTQDRQAHPDGTIAYTASFHLVGYASDRGVATIEPQPVRYYVHTAGQPPDTLQPADEVALAPTSLAIRSVLPDANVTWIRDEKPGAVLPAWVRWAWPVGIGAMVLSLTPVVVGLVSLVRGRRVRARPLRKAGARQHRQALDELRANATLDDPSSRREALARLGLVVRERLEDEGIPAGGLTPDEVEQLMRERTLRISASDVAGLLRDCERAAYAPADQVPDLVTADAAMATATRLFAQKVR